jgi:hypothetical protein
MDDQTTSSKECNCEGNCCPPPPKRPWNKILFFLVILAALAIVAFKLSTKEQNTAVPAKDTISAEKTSVVDSSAAAGCGKDCNSSGKSSCCQEAKK